VVDLDTIDQVNCTEAQSQNMLWTPTTEKADGIETIETAGYIEAECQYT
jgi:hypothetical protein